MEWTERIHEYVMELWKVLSHGVRVGESFGTSWWCRDGPRSITGADCMWTVVLYCRPSGECKLRISKVQQVMNFVHFRPSHTLFCGIFNSYWETSLSLVPFYLSWLNQEVKCAHSLLVFRAWAKTNRKTSCNSLDAFFWLSCSSPSSVSSLASSR